jgi:heat shock transcription factor, other eukaryote
VLDEDEFAKTLIPELFKHNNYASFVRQLNMYGFHKRVGLSDNSMRASERKNKSPSEYSNPYFRRGHPNLLWLINKPKGPGKGKKPAKSGEGDIDSDDEAGQEDGQGQGSGSSHAPPGRALPAVDSQGVQKKEMTVFREELNKVREQQKVILRTINRLQQNNNDLYNQAVLFQTQHDRHQNSINAILHFLANLFRKSLEEQGSNQSVSDIISSLISNQGQQSAPQSNVVDLGDFFQGQVDASTPLAGHKRARGLLPPIPNQDDGSRSTRSPSNARSPYFPIGNSQNQQMGQVTELLDGSPAETPQNLRQELENNPHEQMMKIINDHNASNSSGMDLPEATEIVANAPSNISQDRKYGMGQSPSSLPTGGVKGTGRAPSNIPSSQHAAKAAPVSPPPVTDATAAPSLSPIMRSPAMPPLSINQIGATQHELDQLQRLQSEQDAKISELNEILGPLSPSGRIPGVDDAADTYFDPHSVDLDQYFDSSAFLDDNNFAGVGNGFDMDFNGTGSNEFDTGQATADGIINTPSPTGTEEIPREEFKPTVDTDRGSKRQRIG